MCATSVWSSSGVDGIESSFGSQQRMDSSAFRRLHCDGHRKPSVSVVMFRSAFWYVTVFVLAVSVSSCTRFPSVGQKTRAISLEASVATYRKMIRWGHFDEAVKYLRARDGSEMAPDLERIAHYRITNYNASDPLLTADGTEARVVASIDYYELDSGVLHSLRDEQYWWYDEDDKHWYLGSPLPQFGVE